MNINLEKLLNGYKEVQVNGECNTSRRKELVEEAIKYFQENPIPTRENNFGIKNYASFGDQRSDCAPGYGPTHGSIVFEIVYNRTIRKVSEDGIYLLLTCVENPEINLGKLISKYLVAKSTFEELSDVITNLKELDINN